MVLEDNSTEALLRELHDRLTADPKEKLATLRDEMNLLANCVTGPSFIHIFNLLLWEGPLHFFEIIIKLREYDTSYSAKQVANVLKRLGKTGLIGKGKDDRWEVSTPSFRYLRSLVIAAKSQC